MFALQDEPFFHRWDTIPDVMQVADPRIVPCATYVLAVMSDACIFGCNDSTMSSTIQLDTTPVWGDVVGAFDLELGAYNPADGTVDFNDVAAMTERFRNLDKAPPATWCDLIGEQPEQGNLLNIDFLDISAVVRVFRGGGYPFDPPVPPDGGCP